MSLIISYAIGYLTGALFMLILYVKFKCDKNESVAMDKSNDDPTVTEKEDKNPPIGFFS